MTESRVAGGLLVASLVLWLPVGLLPARIWSATPTVRLELIAARRRRWQAANLSIGAAAVLLVAGVAVLGGQLAEDGAGALAVTALSILGLGAALWLGSLAFRIWPMSAVAGAGPPPPGFELAAAWAGGLFLGWSVLANTAIVVLGAAVLQAGAPAPWCGWLAIAAGGLALAQLLVNGDSLPVLYHVAPALVGVALLAR
jgi:hypothetical protein